MRLGSRRTFVSFIRFIFHTDLFPMDSPVGGRDGGNRCTGFVYCWCRERLLLSWVFVVMEDRDRERERLRQGKASFGFACQGGFLRYAHSACITNGIEVFRETR